MLKLKISKKENSDVTEYRAKGWTAKVLREANPNNTQIIVEKGDIIFKLRTIWKEGEVLGELTKYIGGEPMGVKYFPTNNCGVFGTLYISDSSDSKRVYAFFRNEELQNLIDYFSIRKITFADENNLTVMSDRISQKLYYEDESEENKYRADGIITHNCIQNEDGTISHSVNITDATFILDMNELELFLPLKYSIHDLWDAIYRVYDIEGTPGEEEENEEV